VKKFGNGARTHHHALQAPVRYVHKIQRISVGDDRPPWELRFLWQRHTARPPPVEPRDLSPALVDGAGYRREVYYTWSDARSGTATRMRRWFVSELTSLQAGGQRRAVESHPTGRAAAVKQHGAIRRLIGHREYDRCVHGGGARRCSLPSAHAFSTQGLANIRAGHLMNTTEEQHAIARTVSQFVLPLGQRQNLRSDSDAAAGKRRGSMRRLIGHREYDRCVHGGGARRCSLPSAHAFSTQGLANIRAGHLMNTTEEQHAVVHAVSHSVYFAPVVWFVCWNSRWNCGRRCGSNECDSRYNGPRCGPKRNRSQMRVQVQMLALAAATSAGRALHLVHLRRISARG
jgi:hypothetical protein